MTVWLWIALASALVYWGIFLYLLTLRRWSWAALGVGVLHMLLGTAYSVAPIRALLDPNYVGWQLGLIRFDGLAVVLPATLFLAWALASAWVAVGKGRGRWMKVVAVGDTLFALNLVADFLLDLLRGRLAGAKIEAGEHFTLVGPAAALVVLLLFGLPLAASAFWAARRMRAGGTQPPTTVAAGEGSGESEQEGKGGNDFHYSTARV